MLSCTKKLVRNFFLCGVLLTACSRKKESDRQPELLIADVPGLEPQGRPGTVQLPEKPLPSVLPGDTQIRTSNASHIPLRYSAGRALLPLEGLVSDSGFGRLQANASLQGLTQQEKKQQYELFMQQIVSRLRSKVSFLDVFQAPEIGYFSGWMPADQYPLLKDMDGFPVDVQLSPVIHSDSQPHRAAGGTDLRSFVTTFSGNFSGIERMHVSQFLNSVRRDLEYVPTGREIRVGVTDTGMTLAHPSFLDAAGQKSRVVYMKDFTKEGAGFVSPLAKVTFTRENVGVGVPSAKLVAVRVSGEYLTPDALKEAPFDGKNQTLPFQSLQDEIFVLPEKLLENLEQPKTGVRLGVLTESAFSSRDEKVDINGNGKNDDVFYFFHVPSQGSKPARVWIDFSGTGNFKSSKALRDFNISGDSQDVLSERIGLSITDVETDALGINLPLVRIAIVGFDPGNHGTHVSGIIAARKTLSNDADGTLARGVAPEATLMSNRVCSNTGGCNATRAIIDLAKNGAQIVNMSLGGLTPDNDGYGVQETVINRLTELYDVMFVISAGNSGPGRQTVGSPSTARHALSVAATATQNMISQQYNWPASGKTAHPGEAGDEDFVMFFSSRGPSAAGGFKPNISAPGTQLSSVQLNSTAGSRAGADIYWGTSMAAPAASGAAALLLDAVLQYNKKFPERPMPADALSLRRILLDSARPFQVSSFHPASGSIRKGIYTWIDQGYGMVDLAAAWELLKKKAQLDLPTGVKIKSGRANVKAAQLDYQVRVLRPLGNGKKYDGNQSFKTGDLVGKDEMQRKFGQGLWLTERETDSVMEIHFSRGLKAADLARPDVGDLLRQLNTSAETFELETVFYGAPVKWLKVGVPQSVSCDDEAIAEQPILTLIGAGAIANPVNAQPGPALTPLRSSSLFVCLKKNAFEQLPAGDHGALIRAYRMVDGKRDVTASFEVPVYVTVPHHVAALQAKFNRSGEVRSFGVDRHYVRVPEGVSVLRVSAEVPAWEQGGNERCSAVSLMLLRGINIGEPADLEGSGGVAQNCTSTGAPLPNRRVVKFTELNPRAGIWDVHIFGRYQFPVSTYQLNFDYATFEDLAPLNLTPSTLPQGEFVAKLLESTFDAKPDAGKSVFRLKALLGRTKHEITKDEGLTIIPSAAGLAARTYAADAGTVTIETSSIIPGLDIDLVIDECEDAELTKCHEVASSGNADAQERAVFLPKGGLFYAVRIDPYEVPSETAIFSSTETINAHVPEQGSLNVVSDENDPNVFRISYQFDSEKSVLLKEALFLKGQYEIEGECTLSTASGARLLNLPVHVLTK